MYGSCEGAEMLMQNRMKNMMIDFRFWVRDNTINRELRKNVKVENISIIASDCIGGVLYKALHHRMDSPTINMFFSAPDFIKFCENLDDYLGKEIVCDTEANPDCQYPVGMLGDLKLHLMHYGSVEEAAEKWEIRKKRIHKDSMHFMMNDRNGCTEKEIAAFDALPFQNKVIFTHKPYPQYPSAFYIPGSEQDGFIKTNTSYVGKLSINRRYDYFDIASWLNEGIRKKKCRNCMMKRERQ